MFLMRHSNPQPLNTSSCTAAILFTNILPILIMNIGGKRHIGIIQICHISICIGIGIGETHQPYISIGKNHQNYIGIDNTHQPYIGISKILQGISVLVSYRYFVYITLPKYW